MGISYIRGLNVAGPIDHIPYLRQSRQQSSSDDSSNQDDFTESFQHYLEEDSLESIMDHYMISHRVGQLRKAHQPTNKTDALIAEIMKHL